MIIIPVLAMAWLLCGFLSAVIIEGLGPWSFKLEGSETFTLLLLGPVGLCIAAMLAVFHHRDEPTD